MSLIKKLAGETAIYGLSHILSRILLFVVFTGYLTRTLGDTSEYGIYSDLYSYATLILTILIFRMDTAFFRYASQGDLRHTFNTGFLAVLGFSVIVLIILMPNIEKISAFLHYKDAPHYVRWFAFILVLDAMTALVFAKLRLESRPYRFMFYKLVNVFATIGGVLLFLEVLPRYSPGILSSIDSSLGIVRRVDYVFLSNLIASALVVVLMIREFQGLTWSIDTSLLRKMVNYSLPLVVVGIAGNINQAFATPIQKYFLGSDIHSNLANAGVYSAAAKLAILLNLFTTAFNYAAEPFFFRNAKNQNSLQIYGKVALAYTLVACLVTLSLIFYIDAIILIIGEQYRSGKNVVPILLFAYIFLGLYYNVSIWYKLKDKTHIGALISMAGVITTIAVSLWLLPIIGTVGSAWAALSCYVLMVILGYFTGQRYFPVEYPVTRILAYILTTCLLGYLAMYLRANLDNQWAYFSIVSIILFGIVWWVILHEKKRILT